MQASQLNKLNILKKNLFFTSLLRQNHAAANAAGFDRSIYFMNKINPDESVKCDLKFKIKTTIF